jgi:hypothetical protein
MGISHPLFNLGFESELLRYCTSYSFKGCLKKYGCNDDCKSFIPRNKITIKGLLPWNWTLEVASSDVPRKCPPASHILGTFAGVNIISTLLGVLVGGDCFRRKAKRSHIAWSWIVPLTLQLGANAIIAVLTKRTSGYGQTFSVANLTFFLAARPRLSWIVLLVLGCNSKTYRKTAMANSVAEIVLQLIASYTMGKTANFAAFHGYLVTGKLIGPVGQAAQLMYSASLFYLVLGSASTLCAMIQRWRA